MATPAEVREAIRHATDAMTVRRVFGDPYERNGVTVIPAARVQGGAGAGGGEGPDGEGSGSGFGLNAKPSGAFVIHGDDVEWRPAVDVNRLILGAQLVAVAALLLARTVVKTRATHDESAARSSRRSPARAFRAVRDALPFTDR